MSRAFPYVVLDVVLLLTTVESQRFVNLTEGNVPTIICLLWCLVSALSRNYLICKITGIFRL